MASRQLEDWLNAYMTYTKNTEPPKSYHVWTGISVIAAALQRKVFMRWGHETIFPNMYIVLIGPSGKCRKGTAMAIGADLLSKLKDVTVAPEATTKEALIRAMKTAVSSAHDLNNPTKITMHCSLTAMSQELSVFLGQQDVKFLATLTNWYDSLDKWTYETKGAGTDEIQGVCFNLLGATAPDWLQSILPEEAIGGGFTSRVIFVVEDKKGKTVSQPEFTDRDRRLREALQNDLERISLLVGEMEFTDEAVDLYTSWYEDQDRQALKGVPIISDPKFAGYCERRSTHIKKLCMVLSASRGASMIMTADEFLRARRMLEFIERRMPEVFGGMGQSQYGQITEKLLRYIAEKKMVYRSTLLAQFYRDVDSGTLQIVEMTLEKMHAIKIHHAIDANDVKYEYVGGKK